MRVDVDLDADAAYITIAGGDVARTVELSKRLSVDEDRAGELLGIEVLGLGSLPVAEVLERYPLPERQADHLRALSARWTPVRLEVA